MTGGKADRRVSRDSFGGLACEASVHTIPTLAAATAPSSHGRKWPDVASTAAQRPTHGVANAVLWTATHGLSEGIVRGDTGEKVTASLRHQPPAHTEG
jgi:hypothetical protein